MRADKIKESLFSSTTSPNTHDFLPAKFSDLFKLVNSLSNTLYTTF